jgi:hypothetical protein
MSFRPQRILILILILIFIPTPACSLQDPQPLQQKTIPQFSVLEISLQSNEQFANPFWDPKISATFTSPSHKSIHVDGFYYGQNEYRIRFVPREQGTWHYTATLKGQKTIRQSGTFDCQAAANDGFLHLSKRNPYRLQYDSGRAFTGLGIQTCGLESRPDFDAPTNSNQWGRTSVENWAKTFNGAVNLVRVQLTPGSPSGCSVPLIPNPDRPDFYNLDTCKKLDHMYQLHRANGFSEIAILFQDMSTYGKILETFGMVRDTRDYKSLHAPNLPLQDKYIRYVVARYACYVDIWEMFNEDSYAPNDYLAHIHKILRDADPYDHIITTNFERPEQDFCEIVCPHEYMNIPAWEVDAELVKQIAALKSYGKPVQYTEFGNKARLSNVDPIKWRVAAWTAYMNETGILFWGMSGKKTTADPKNVGNSNAYIGPEERAQFRVLLNFTRDLPIDLRPRFSMDSPEFQYRSYVLSNDAITIAYFHRRGAYNYEGKTKPQTHRIRTGPGRFRVQWINPEDGKAIGQPYEVATTAQFLGVNVPSFQVDLACRIDRVIGPTPPPPLAKIGPKTPASPAPAGWKVAWTADLVNPAAAKDWLPVAGDLAIRDSILCLRTEEDSEAEATLATPRFPADVRVEFVAYLAGDNPGDLTTLLGTNATGIASGYALQFGAKARTQTRVLRAGKLLGEDQKETRLEIGRAYRIVAEREGDTLRLFVDGEKVIERHDDRPLKGRGLDRIGFYTYGGTLCIKELRVLTKTGG